MFAICHFGRDNVELFGYGILLFLAWASLRLILISFRRINLFQSVCCALSFVLEFLVMGDYANFAFPQEFTGQVNLLSLQRLALCAFVFGRILDFYILKPYFKVIPSPPAPPTQDPFPRQDRDLLTESAENVQFFGECLALALDQHERGEFCFEGNMDGFDEVEEQLEQSNYQNPSPLAQVWMETNEYLQFSAFNKPSKGFAPTEDAFARLRQVSAAALSGSSVVDLRAMLDAPYPGYPKGRDN